MKIGTIKSEEQSSTALFFDQKILELKELAHIDGYQDNWGEGLDSIITTGFSDLHQWYKLHLDKIKNTGHKKPVKDVDFLPPYSNPPKIWGIGLNYRDHAKDLDEDTPKGFPGSFMRPTTTITGHNGTVKIPPLTKRTTGEAELGIIIGKKGKSIEGSNWLDYVAGFTTIIDMTAEDILRQNPRFLTLSKAFDTYFSFGPQILTPDELVADISNLTVSTCYNGDVYASNTISNMTFSPQELVTFHSQVMTLLPGDIISTGTPRAVSLEDGSTIECRIDGFLPLKNKVKVL
jgi:2-keto-4-pentenoate hydratase/2-oxohepta-3-ene-1,7-dioic acid hydratase in catechol pathway